MDNARFITLENLQVPRFFYGTAWKEERTQALTSLAIAQGFRAIDTANQRRHYFEARVGAAVARSIELGEVSRRQLFLQTKFTFTSSQDHRLPYDPHAPVRTQVAQSCESSLRHLRTDYLDSYLLHGPSSARGLAEPDLEAWRAMEAQVEAGRVRLLGISNVSREQLQQLAREARVQPAFVQNRCFAQTGWDRKVRTYCSDHGIVYQGFSLLTANKAELGSATLRRIAQHNAKSPAQVVFRFALQVGIIPVTGTERAEHMVEDLACFDFALSERELASIERI